MTAIVRLGGVLALMLAARVACAQSDTPWRGFYFGVNAGSASNNACDKWSTAANPASGLALRACPGGAFVGGVQFGQNFQVKRLVYGLDFDIDAWESKSDDRTISLAQGALPAGSAPAGTYRTAGRLTPSEFLFVGPRIGYGGGNWFPYLKGGGLIASSSHVDGLSYTEAGASKPLVSFAGGRNYASAGWAAGAGIEVGLHGAFALSAEFLHAALGNASNGAASCSGPAAACAEFAALGVTSTHDSFTANLFRIGVTYYFQYWSP